MKPKIEAQILRSRYLPLLIIFLAAFSLKLTLFFSATEPVIFYKYPHFAQMIVQGSDIGERILDLSPLYLYVNLLFYKIYGTNWEMLAVIQIFLGSLNCAFIYLLGEKIFGKVIGYLAALLLFLYGNLTLIELTLEPEAFVLFLNTLAVLSLYHCREEAAWGRSYWSWMVPGFLLGLSIVTKPNALLLLPLAVVWIWLGRGRTGIKTQAALCLVLAAGLVVLPVTLRNYIKFKDIILITADGGKVFFHGNGPGSTGMERADLPHQGFLEEGLGEPDAAHALFRKVARQITGRPLTPSECARFWTAYTLNYMRGKPLSAFVLEIKKFLYFWNSYEVHDIDSTYKSYQKIRSWPLLPFGVLAALGAVGMFLALPDFRRAFLLYAGVLVYLFSVLIFFSASRYRLPATPFLSIFGAYTLIWNFSRFKEKQWAKALLCLAALAFAWAAPHWFFQNNIGAFDRWQRATRIHYSLGGNVFFQRGHYRQAADEYEKAIALQPGFAPAHNRLGKVYAVLNEFESAETHFRKVIELAPGVDQGYLNLGLLYVLKGAPQEALLWLEKALAVNPNNTQARKQIQKINPRIGGKSASP